MHTELEHERTCARLLRELPDEAAQPYDFREFQRRAFTAPAAAARVARMRALALGVVITLAVLAAAIRFGGGPRAARPAATTVTAENSAPSAGAEQSDAEQSDAAQSDAAQSGAAREQAAARYLLERLPREPAVVRVGTRAAVETLEDHIAQVDDLLSSERAGSAPAARLRVLQQERAQLVNSLVQVRYAETLADAAR